MHNLVLSLGSAMAYTIKALPGRGRGLVAARTIKAGETIIAEEPLLLTVAQEAKDTACAHCLRLLTAGARGGGRQRPAHIAAPAPLQTPAAVAARTRGPSP